MATRFRTGFASGFDALADDSPDLWHALGQTVFAVAVVTASIVAVLAYAWLRATFLTPF